MTDQVVDNAQQARFELEVDGQLAELVYERHGDRFVLVHTEVPEALEGRGLGGRLVSAALDEAEAKGLTIVARCPFAKQWLRTHPDAAARVPVVYQ